MGAPHRNPLSSDLARQTHWHLSVERSPPSPSCGIRPGELGTRSLADRVRQGALRLSRRVQVDQRSALTVIPHPGHELLEVRVRVGGELIAGVPKAVKVATLGAGSGQRVQPRPVVKFQ